MENEAKIQDTLPESLRRLFEDRELLAHDDAAFETYLIEMVRAGAMKPTHALYLYAQRHHMDKIELANIKLTDVTPRPAVLDFFDLMLNQGDISGLLKALSCERPIGGGECSSNSENG